MGFSERLKAERVKKGLTQRGLAEKIKATNTSLCNWENKVSEPSASVISLLSKALEISPFDLLGDFTLRDIQMLDRMEPSKRTFEQNMALTFSADILKEANVDLTDVASGLQDLSRNIKDLANSIESAVWQMLLSDGGEKLLIAYDCLNTQGKGLLLDYITCLLRVPVYLEEPEIGVDEIQIAELKDVKDKLNITD